ncbi:phage major capsid protein [Haliangium sp.]|uniref:phage major capsid protein n=1 Tax=Haliangium sp. TaxID=2663208 RepID=UPI003D10B2A0
MGMDKLIYDNRTLLAKADMALADLTTDGGVLQPEEAKKFIRILIRESVLLKLATVVPMKAPKKLIDRIGFQGRILRAASEGTRLTEDERSRPHTEQEELDAKLFKAEVRLRDEVLEDSIERGALRQTIMQMMGEQISADMDEITVRGDTDSPDGTLAKIDGVLKQATSHVVDAGGATTNRRIFRDMLKSMPSPYLRRRKRMQFLTSVNSEIDYRDLLGERLTAAGDKHNEEDVPAKYSGIPVRDVPNFPEDLGAGGNTTDILLTDPKNIHVGVWRKIRIETDKDISAGELIIVATLRFDVKYEERDAVVKAINVAVD